jgi:hypothetical protein
MTLPQSTNNNIDFSSNTELPLEDLIAQMEKELQMSGENYTFRSFTASELIDELAYYMDDMQSCARISNLLYRIDVNPAKADPKLPYYTALSILSWNRVFKKVWFRRKFKTGNI